MMHAPARQYASSAGLKGPSVGFMLRGAGRPSVPRYGGPDRDDRRRRRGQFSKFLGVIARGLGDELPSSRSRPGQLGFLT